MAERISNMHRSSEPNVRFCPPAGLDLGSGGRAFVALRIPIVCRVIPSRCGVLVAAAALEAICIIALLSLSLEQTEVNTSWLAYGLKK
jgi:hypothetical protein